MTRQALHRGVLWVGLVGSFVFVLAGTWILVSRVWARSFTQTLEVLVAAPFLAVWVLSPILWAAWPRSEPPRTQGDEVISFVASVLLVGVGGYAYVSEFVVRPLFLDVVPGLESLVLVGVVPGMQWVILGTAGVVRWARGKTSTGTGNTR